MRQRGRGRLPRIREGKVAVHAALMLFGLLLAAAPASAQTVLVRVLDAESQQPLFGALAYLDTPEGATVRSVLTDERGRAIFVGMAPGRYRVRAEMIGKRTAVTEPFRVGEGETVAQDLRLESSAIELEGIEVEAEGGRCSVRPEEGLAVARVWDEVRKALTGAALADRERMYRYRTVKYVREVDRDTRAIRHEERERVAGFLRTPFESRPAEELIERGFVQKDGNDAVYFGPDAQVLLSDVFLDTHCFGLRRGEGDAAGLIGLRFEPVRSRKRLPDIAGTLWIDPETYELRFLEYRYVNLDPDLSSPEVGGYVAFRRLPNGTWIVPEWWIRMPKVGYVRDHRGRLQPYLEAYTVAGGIVTEVQEQGGRTVIEAETGSIEGIVLDSLGVEPLRGARVRIAGSRQSVYTDREGRFRIAGLSDGRYEVEITHPRLEQLGFRPEPLVRDVRKGEITQIRYVMPSVGDVAFQVCRGQAMPERSAVLTGWVRDAATSSPLSGVTVQARWSRVRMAGVGTEDARITGTTTEGVQVRADERGAYHVCGVPQDRLIEVAVLVEGERIAADTLRISELERVRPHIIEVRR